MPSLRPQPNDELIRRIRSLERRLDEAANIRRRVAAGASIAASNFSQTFGPATTSGVFLGTVAYATDAAMVATANVITVPADGVYMVTYSVPAMFADLASGDLSGETWVNDDLDNVNSAVPRSGAMIQVPAVGFQSAHVSFPAVLEADTPLRLVFRNHSGSTFTYQQHGAGPPFTLTVERLHDIPSYATN